MWDNKAPAQNYRELDIEFARWGQATADNAQYVVQPYQHAGNLLRFTMPATAVRAAASLSALTRETAWN